MKKIYLTHLQYKIYQILKDIKKEIIYLYEIANMLKLKSSDVYRSLLFLKAKGVIDFDEIRDKYYSKTYKIIIKNIKDIKNIQKNANYIIAEIDE